MAQLKYIQGKPLQPCLNIYLDASLKGVGEAFSNSVYELPLPHHPGWCIVHWEGMNILIAVRVFSRCIACNVVIIWCDSKVTVSVLNSGRGSDSILHSVARISLYTCKGQR
jgi:hypothetical protein